LGIGSRFLNFIFGIFGGAVCRREDSSNFVGNGSGGGLYSASNRLGSIFDRLTDTSL
jgi:hypothetical protein